MTGGSHAHPGPRQTSDALPTRRSRLLSLVAVGEVGVIAALILLVAFFSALEPAFVSERNLRAILRVVSFVGIIAIGQTMLLVSGEFDLSVGSVAGLSAVVAAKLMTAAALPVPVAIAAASLAGALRRPRQRPRRGPPAHPGLHPDPRHALHRPGPDPGRHQRRAGLPAAPLGRRLRHGRPWSSASAGASSSSSSPRSSPTSSSAAPSSAATCTPPAATPRSRASSASTPTATRSAPSSSSACSPRSPACSSWPISPAAPPRSATAGSSAVIAGVVVGGVSLFGGAGTLAGGIVGILLLQVVTSGLVVIGVSANWQQIAVGVIMVLAVGLDIARRRYFIAGAGRREPAKSARAPARRQQAAQARNPDDAISIGIPRGARPPQRSRRCSARRRRLAQDEGAPLGAADARPPGPPADAGGLPRKCKELGYTCEVVGNPSATNYDVAGLDPARRGRARPHRVRRGRRLRPRPGDLPLHRQARAGGLPRRHLARAAARGLGPGPEGRHRRGHRRRRRQRRGRHGREARRQGHRSR